MKQRIVSILLTLALCLSLLPATALAVEDGAPTEETPVCNCETACAEGNMNTECPMCGAEGAAPENCGQYQAPEQDDVGEEPGDPADSEPTAAEQVQAMIDALPTAEELSAMSLEEQQAVYEQLQAANDAYEALTDEQKAEVTGTEIFDELFEYLNSLTMTTGTTSNVQTDDSVAVVNGVYYTDFMEALKAATTTNMQPDMRTYCTLLKDITISSSLQG